MRAIQARTLRAHIDAGSVAISDAVKLVRRLAELVEAEHHKGVVHCGVKPSSVILTRDGEGNLQPRLSNVGATSSEEETLTGDETLTSGVLRDAVRYISPEECRGLAPNPRSDVYSLGVILYEMLAGHTLFDGATAGAIAQKHIEEMPSHNNLRLGDLQMITPLVMRALHKNPASRPPAAEFARSLRHLEYLTASVSRTTPETIIREARVDQAETSIHGEAISQREAVIREEARLREEDIQISLPIPLEPVGLPSDATTDNAHPVPPSEPSIIEADASGIPLEEITSEVEAVPHEAKAVVDEVGEPTGYDEELTQEVRRIAGRSVGISVRPFESSLVAPTQIDADVRRHNFAPDVEHPRDVVYETKQNPDFTTIMVTVSDSRPSPSEPPPTSTTRILLLLGCVALVSIFSTFGVAWLFSPGTSSPSSTDTAASRLPVGGAASEERAAKRLPGNELPELSTQAIPSEVSDSSVLGDSTAADVLLPNVMSVRRRTTPSAEPRAELNRTLSGWAAAAKSRDIDRQMSFYMPRLTVYYGERNVSRSAVRRAKTRLLRRSVPNSLQVNEPDIEFSPDGRTAIMRFRKTYLTRGRQGNSRNEVVQELHWVMTDEGWKIIGERDAEVIG